MKKIIEWYKSQSDTVKALVWIGVISVIGIILRWEYVVDSISKGFNFYNIK